MLHFPTRKKRKTIDPSMSWRLPALNTWISTKIFVSLRNCIVPACTILTYVLWGKLCPPVAKCSKSPACVPSIQSRLILSLKDAKTSWWNLRTSLDCTVPRHLLPFSVITFWVLRKKQSAWRSDPRAFQYSAGCCGVKVTRSGDTVRGRAFVLCLHALSIHFSLLILRKGMLWRNTWISVFHLCCYSVLRTHCCSSEHFKHVCFSKFAAAAEFQLQVSSPLGFLSKWDSWTRWAPPSAISTRESPGRCSEEPLESPPLFTGGRGSLYVLCFSGSLDSLDL